MGEHSAVASILTNKPSPGLALLPGMQGNASNGAVGTRESHRVDLQRRLAGFLGLDTGTTSVICISSGTRALQKALRALLTESRPKTRNEVIVPATAVALTAEAVIMEGFVPVFTDVDPHSWMLSPEATEKNISDKTAAIITVDWLGIHCDLGPFRKLADKYSVKLISESTQSFGAIRGKPSVGDLADATIYNTGFPNVFHTGGSGGVLICSKSQADWLEREPAGIFWHEAMHETNAFQGLRALDELPRALETRAKVANTYHQLLSGIPGIAFPRVPPGSRASYYQLSVTVDAESFGLDAKVLCEALRAENVLCSTERMLCLGSIPRLLQSCKVVGGLPVSQALSESLITLPNFELTPEIYGTICSLVKAIQEQSATILASRKSLGAVFPPPRPSGGDDVIDIASKFRDCSVVRIVDYEREFPAGEIDDSVPSTVLVPRGYMAEHKISIDELHRQLLSKQEWSWGDEVINDLIVHAKKGRTVFLSPRGQGHSRIMEGSGSSAHVALVIERNGEVVVRKSCSRAGIDGNGLKRQHQFLGTSVAVKETDIFVKPLGLTEIEGVVSTSFPYVPSHSLAEVAFAGMGATPLLAVLADLVGEMATCVWSKGVCNAPADFIEQAHFNRMKRRVEIARAQVPLLDKVASYQSITLNGRKLLGFDRVLQALSRHSSIAEISPRKLSELHGDLSLHNILCQLEPGADRPIVLIDPRGVPLLGEFADSLNALEPGDYCYDLSKLKFSLSGFAEIRKGLFSFQDGSQSFKLGFQNHPGSDTMTGADRGFIKTLLSNERLRQWIEAVEPSGLRSMELRVLLGEAAHFVADAACALGRDREEEVLPLFLTGIEKLNDVLELVEGKGRPNLSSAETEVVTESPNYGAARIRTALLGLGSPTDASWAWDVMEVLVNSRSTTTAQQLLSELVGEYLPEGTGVHVSTDPVASVRFPCVVIHPFDDMRGQTHAVLSGIRRMSAFLRETGMPQDVIDGLRIVTISSTGESTRSQYTSRENEKLLSPGPWGISPLKLSMLQANQLVFPRGGRWVVENDSFFVLSRALRVGGDGLCLLVSKRPTAGSEPPWSVCIDSTDEIDGRKFAAGFREIGPDEKETKLLRHTSAIFLPNHLGQSLARKEEDYATRTSPMLIDFVLPRFMQRADWIQLCCSQGFVVNSDIAWNNAKETADLSSKVELSYGGDEMEFYHFGSDSEYIKLVDGVGSNPLLNSLAYLPSMAKWLHRTVGISSSLLWASPDLADYTGN